MTLVMLKGASKQAAMIRGYLFERFTPEARMAISFYQDFPSILDNAF